MSSGFLQNGWTRLALGVIAATFCGFVAFVLDVPLAWMLGALIGSAALSIGGVDINPPAILRRVGQATVGTTVGLYVSPVVVAQLALLLPLMIAVALMVVVVSVGLSLVLAILARIDHRTAFLAMMPGGVAEMGNVAMRFGADETKVSIAQSMRVAFVVLVLPPLLLLAVPQALPDPVNLLDPFLSLGLIACGLGFARLVSRTGLNNPWMLGAAIFCGTLAATSIVSGRMPPPIFACGQLLLGLAVGSRFKRKALLSVPRLTIVYLVMMALLLGVVFLLALSLAQLTGMEFQTLILAAAPGGLAEMSTTASVLGFSVTTITGFHVVRSFAVNGFVTHYWALFSRFGFFASGDRLLRKVFRL